jgi:topoisomerase-4 subunit A
MVWMASGDLKQPWLLHSTSGQGFVAHLGDMVSRLKAGKEFMKVASGARALAPVPVPKFSGDAVPRVATLSSDARLLVFLFDEVPVRTNGGVGVQLMALPDGVTLASAAVCDGAHLTVEGIHRNKRASVTLNKKELRSYDGRRAQRGRIADVGIKSVDRLKG